MAPRPTILVVEDDRRTAEWLRLYLERAGCDVCLSHDGHDAIDQAERLRPDLVLLDLLLPGVNGLAVCRHLRETGDMLVLIITARTAEDDRLRGFEAGADDYICKPFSPREVVARVRAVLRRARQHDEEPTVSWRECFVNLVSHEVRVGAADPIRLTAVESRLLAALLRAPGRVLTRAHLLDRVFGGDYAGHERTIDVHVKNLRRKLEAVGTAAPRIDTVHGEGYRVVAHDRPA